MSDILYPLRYASRGSIAVTADESEERRSRLLHLLDTLVGERYVYPNFGLPVDMLFDTSVAELTVERVRLTIAQNLPDVPVTVSLMSFDDVRITIQVTYESGVITVTL